MKKSILFVLCLLLSVCVSWAEDVDIWAGVDIASAYVYKGATYNDGMVIQPCVEIASDPITIGAWINYDVDDYNKTLHKDTVSEVDFYAIYSFPFEAVDLMARTLDNSEKVE